MNEYIYFCFLSFSVTNWLLSHAVRSLNSCPEEFFDLLPVVSNLNINNIPIQVVN